MPKRTPTTNPSRRKRSRRKPNLTWNQAIDRHETHLLALNQSPLTIRRKLKHLTHLQRSLTSHTSPATVTLHDLRHHQLGLFTGTTSHCGRPLDVSTIASMTGIYRGFFGWLFSEELIGEDPTARLEVPKVPEKVVGDVLTVAEIRALIAACDAKTAVGQRDRVVVELFYATGVRVSELLALDLGDIDRQDRVLTVRSGKGGKGRRIPITRSASQALEAYLAWGRQTLAGKHPDSAIALVLSTRGRRMNKLGPRTLLLKLAEAAGVAKRISPHTIRRSFATQLLKSGVSIRHLQLLLGHASLDSTARYLKLDLGELRKEILLHHPRERFE